MPINDASLKIRNAAECLTLSSSPQSARTLYGYLEGDVLRHLKDEHRRELLPLMAGIRAEHGPGAPSWQPNVKDIVPRLVALADKIAATERVSFTQLEYDRRIAAAKETGRTAALDAASAAMESKIADAFLRGQEIGREEGRQMERAEMRRGANSKPEKKQANGASRGLDE